MRFQRGFRYLPEHKVLATAHDGDRKLMLFRGGKDEGHTRRGFFQGLQQGVEGFLGEHMRFVYDENLVAAFKGRIPYGIAQAANIVDTSVGSTVYFHHINKRTLRDTAAGFALVAGLPRGGVLAVQGLGKDTGDGGLTHTARTAEQIGRGHAVFTGGTGEDGLHHVLPDHFGECLRAVKGRKRCVCCHRISSASSAVKFGKSQKSLRPEALAVKKNRISDHPLSLFSEAYHEH